MKNLSLSSIIEANSFSGSDTAWLIALKIHVRNHQTGAEVSQIRVINNSEITSIEGEPYEPMSFSIDIKEESNQLPSMTVTIQDQAELVGPFMQRYGGGVGFDVEMMIVQGHNDGHDVDQANGETEPELVEFFTVTNSGYKDYVASWTLGAENPLKRMFPLRKQEDNQCSFRYKEPTTCGYNGAKPTCDLTLDGVNGCRAHANTKNFGAYPGIIVRS